MASGPSQLPYLKVVLMGVDVFLSDTFACFLHTDTFFSPLAVSRSERLLKEGTTGAFIVQRLIQIACQSVGFDRKEKQIGEKWG